MGPEGNRYAHTHVLATLMGEGDPEFVAAVRRPVDPKRVLYVGLTETSPLETDFIQEHGIARLSPEDLAGSPERVLEWLRASGARKVAVHFDLDVLDPSLSVRSASICFDARARSWIRTPKRQLLQIMNGATVKAARVRETFRDRRMAVITASVTAATLVPITVSMMPQGPKASVLSR